MHSLKSIREEILTQTDISPENVSSFVEKGTLRSHYEKPDSGANPFFRIEYTAVLILLNCAHPAEYIMHLVAQWLHRHHPSHSPIAVSFEAEILDHTSVDLKINISGIADTYKPTEQQDGTLIIGCTNQAADPILRPAGALNISTHP